MKWDWESGEPYRMRALSNYLSSEPVETLLSRLLSDDCRSLQEREDLATLILGRLDHDVSVGVAPVLFAFDDRPSLSGQYQDRRNLIAKAVKDGALRAKPSGSLSIAAVLRWAEKRLPDWEPRIRLDPEPDQRAEGDWQDEASLCNAVFMRFYAAGAKEHEKKQSQIVEWVWKQRIAGRKVSRKVARGIVKKVAPSDRQRPGLRS